VWGVSLWAVLKLVVTAYCGLPLQLGIKSVRRQALLYDIGSFCFILPCSDL
jgi:hypothetical protein